jgi:hypothetical protein
VQTSSEADHLTDLILLESSDVDSILVLLLACVVVDGKVTILGALFLSLLFGRSAEHLLFPLAVGFHTSLHFHAVLLFLGLTLMLPLLVAAHWFAIAVQREVLGGGVRVVRVSAHLLSQKAEWTL